MAATKFSFFVISTLDRGDFPRIIVIDLYCIFLLYYLAPPKTESGPTKIVLGPLTF